MKCLITTTIQFLLPNVIRKVPGRVLGRHINGNHWELTYADDVNLKGDYIGDTERSADVLLDFVKTLV